MACSHHTPASWQVLQVASITQKHDVGVPAAERGGTDRQVTSMRNWDWATLVRRKRSGVRG